MGNQAGKGGPVTNLYRTADVRTREAIAGWHRYGVSVWDVYDLEEELGQGSMGSVYQVRRKERGAHTAATRQRTVSSTSDSASDRSEPPKAAAKSPKLGPKRILKTTRRSISGGVAKMVGMSKEVDEALDVDAPPTITLSEPPKNPSQPKPILKPSHYRNPTNEIPDVDDDSEDEDEEKSMERWKERSKDRVEHIAGHRSVVLGHQGPALDSAKLKPEDPFLANTKVAFKRHYACKLVLIPLVKEGQMEDMINEIYIMRTLDHPYILQLYEIYQVKRTYFNTLDEIRACAFVTPLTFFFHCLSL
jgi:serine/threonine protein kinase